MHILVGYDSKRMDLAGSFSYDKKNQRTLPFNVEINELPEHKTIFAGSSSKFFLDPNYSQNLSNSLAIQII